MLIKRQPDKLVTQSRIRVIHSVAQEIEAYCQWAGIQCRDYFIQAACEYIFKNDEDWLNYKNKEEVT